MANELKLTKGDSVTFRNTIKNNNVVVDISSYTCYFTVKTNKTDADADAVIGPITGTPINAVSGIVDFILTTTHTSIDAGTYYYDIEIVDGATTNTVISSTLSVLTDVKRTAEDEDDVLYITPEELRTFLQYDTNDYPTPQDMRFFIEIAQRRLALDIDSSDTNILFIATLLLGKTYVLRSMASRSVKTGYVQVNAEGRTITKAYQELVLDAENSYQEYKEFLLNVARQEAMSTNFMDDTNNISSLTRQQIIDIMNGTTNAEITQNARRYDYFWRR